MAKSKKLVRKLVRIRAENLHAGDNLAMKVGSVRKYYHVCEITHIGKGEDADIYVTWNTIDGFSSRRYDPDDKVVVRRYV